VQERVFGEIGCNVGNGKGSGGGATRPLLRSGLGTATNVVSNAQPRSLLLATRDAAAAKSLHRDIQTAGVSRACEIESQSVAYGLECACAQPRAWQRARSLFRQSPTRRQALFPSDLRRHRRSHGEGAPRCQRLASPIAKHATDPAAKLSRPSDHVRISSNSSARFVRRVCRPRQLRAVLAKPLLYLPLARAFPDEE